MAKPAASKQLGKKEHLMLDGGCPLACLPSSSLWIGNRCCSLCSAPDEKLCLNCGDTGLILTNKLATREGPVAGQCNCGASSCREKKRDTSTKLVTFSVSRNFLTYYFKVRGNLADDIFGWKNSTFCWILSRFVGNKCHASLNKIHMDGSVLSKMRI